MKSSRNGIENDWLVIGNSANPGYARIDGIESDTLKHLLKSKHINYHLNEPFWRSNQIWGESLFFIRKPGAELASSRLLFCPTDSVRLTSSSRDTIYQAGKDYVIDPDSGLVTLTPGSSIPFIDDSELCRETGQELAIAHRRDNEREWLYFSEGHYFHDRQAEATYRHDAHWQNTLPKYQGDSLPITVAKLREGAPVHICLCGDSISAGANASAKTGVSPYMPPYPDLFAAELHRTYTAPVTLQNFSVGGKTSAHGIEVAEGIVAENPDLILIAYGMNDAGARDVEGYRNNISRIIDITRKHTPAAEIILIASMLGNPEWHYTPREVLFDMRDALQILCQDGIALADLTQLWSDMLKIKSYYDLTGNGVNHPNDFGHRIYTQVLLDVLAGPDL